MMMRFLFFLLLINISFSKKPNIVLIMADDLGYESISVNGGKSYLTPNIDMLAKKGLDLLIVTLNQYVLRQELGL